MLIEHMAQGKSYESFGAKVNCGRSTLYDWEKVFPEWKRAKRAGQERALDFFETRLVAKVSGQDIVGFDPKKSDTSCLIFALKTRFHTIYGEKQELNHTGDQRLVIDMGDSDEQE